jgi:hypothetical protein
MTSLLILALQAIGRALLAHVCGELFRMILHSLAPGMPPLACIVIGLVLGVGTVEIP